MTKRRTPPHGTEARYRQGCRAPQRSTCPGTPSCAAAHSATVQARERARLAGRPRRVPVGPAFEAIQALHVLRVQDIEIAVMAGCSERAVNMIRLGRRQTVRRETDEALRYVAARFTDEKRSPRTYPRAALDRLVHGMLLLGYARRWIAAEAGISLQVIQGLERPPRRVLARNLAPIQALAVRVRGVPATPERTGTPQWTIDRIRRNAAQAGWRSLPRDPMYVPWDLDDLDDEPPAPPAPRHVDQLAADTEAADRRFLAVLYAVVIEGVTLKRATLEHGYEPASRLRTLGLKFEYDPKLGRSRPREACVEAARVAAGHLRAMPIDEVALVRTHWSVDDIDPDWSATTAFAALKAELVPLKPARARRDASA